MEKVKEMRQMINERMANHNLEIFVKTNRIKKRFGVPFVEALRKAESKKRIIASNKGLRQVLFPYSAYLMSNVKEFEQMEEGVWSGTMTAYEEPGKMLDKYITYTDPKTKQRYVFPVPARYRKDKDAILVVEHPNYTLDKDGKDLVVAAEDTRNIGIVRKITTEWGYSYFDLHAVEPRHGIPRGDPLELEKTSTTDGKSGSLYRTDKRIGPIGFSAMIYGIDCRSPPSSKLGVLVESRKDNNADKNTKEGDEK